MNLSTHKVLNGNNYVYTYKRTGTTIVPVNDLETKYYEFIIFQIDTSLHEFRYCDSSLTDIDCRYYWICFAKELKKVSKVVTKGCIEGNKLENSIQLKIKVEVDFGFGGILDEDKNRTIEYKKIIPLHSKRKNL